MSTTTTAEQHYEQLLAEVYDWMQGGWDVQVETHRHQLAVLGIGPAPSGARAIDIGAGTGYQSIPLAELGYAVAAIDPSASMLRQLEAHLRDQGRVDLQISTLHGVFDDRAGPQVDLICCMGDTLAHLDSHDQVDQLLQRAFDTLLPGGSLVMSYRDGTAPPEGDARFLPIRSDHDRIFTCFLEMIDDDHLRIHDILHTKNAEGFTQHVSSYVKLRLRPDAIDRSLGSVGFREVSTTFERGLVTTIASVDR